MITEIHESYFTNAIDSQEPYACSKRIQRKTLRPKDSEGKQEGNT